MSEDKPKVLILMGSPRKKGNTATLAGRIAAGAETAGAEVEIVRLNSLKIAPCQACNGCRKKDGRGCVVDDDMQTLYPKILAARSVVYASPVYWFTVAAQLKLVMDRCYAFGANDYKDMHGKRAAVAMCYADADPFISGCGNALRTFQDAFRYMKMELVGMVYGNADQPGEIAGNAALMAEAEELGKKLVAE